MKLPYKTLFTLIGLSIVTTSVWAAKNKCCPLDSVALCGDDCCKYECDSKGKCPACSGDDCCKDISKPGTSCEYECQKDENTYKWVKTDSTCCPDGGKLSTFSGYTEYCCKNGYALNEKTGKYDTLFGNGKICGCPDDGTLGTDNETCCKDGKAWDGTSYTQENSACPYCSVDSDCILNLESSWPYCGECVANQCNYNSGVWAQDNEACCLSVGQKTGIDLLFDTKKGSGCYDPSDYKQCKDGSVVYKSACCDSDPEANVKDVENGHACYRCKNGVWEFDSYSYKMVDGKCYRKDYCFSDADCTEYTELGDGWGSCGYCTEEHYCSAIPAGDRRLDPDFSCCRTLGGSNYHCGDNQWCCLPGDSECARENC